MKRVLIIFSLFLFLSVFAFSQAVTLTGNVTDLGGVVWSNATIRADFVPAPNSPGNPTSTGCTLATTVNSTTDGSGNFSFSVCPNNKIVPTGSLWRITFCPNATSQCFVATSASFSVSTNITSILLTQVPALVINQGAYPAIAIGYDDSEIPNPRNGMMYFNTSQSCMRVYNNSWSCSTGGAGGLPGFVQVSTTIQAAVNTACAANPVQGVYIPPNYTGVDNYTNPCGTVVFNGRKIGMYRGGDLSVQDFGARGDGGWYSGFNCTNGSSVLGNAFYNNLTNAGVAPKIGQLLLVSGCGVAGADLQCTIGAVGSPGTNVTCGGGVTAGATLTNRGARWGYSLDDSAAIQAASDFCHTMAGNGGCNLNFPPGIYFVNIVNSPIAGSSNTGRVVYKGSGMYSANLIGIGAASSGILTVPSGSVPVTVRDLGFNSFDYINKQSTAIEIQGGNYHYIYDNYMTNVVDMAHVNSSTEGRFTGNRGFPSVNGFHGGDIGFVNAWEISYNSIGSGFSGKGISLEGSTQQNQIIGNTLQQDNPPFQQLISAGDSASFYVKGYEEYVTPSITGNYVHTFAGQGNVVVLPYMFCENFSGSNNTLIAGLATGNCSGKTYAIDNTGGDTNICFGCSEANINGGVTHATYFGRREFGVAGAIRIKSSDLTQSTYKSTTWEWLGGAGSSPDFVESYSSPVAGNNPSVPNIPNGGVINPGGVIRGNIMWNKNTGAANSSPYDNGFAGWGCISMPCTSNGAGLSGGIMAEFGPLRTRRVREGTAVPVANAYVPGDLLWNNTPGNATKNNPCWYNTTAGSPGTWWNCLGANQATSIISFQVSLTPGVVSANTCATQLFTGGSGLLGTSDVMIAVNHPTNQPGLIISPGQYVPTTQFNWNVCNVTAGSLTPTAETYTIVFLRMQ